MEEINNSFDTLKDLTINFKDFENHASKFIFHLNQKVDSSGIEQVVDVILDDLLNEEVVWVKRFPDCSAL
jgi:hypothetical protein